jgi:hypothetical protein
MLRAVFQDGVLEGRRPSTRPRFDDRVPLRLEAVFAKMIELGA